MSLEELACRLEEVSDLSLKLTILTLFWALMLEGRPYDHEVQHPDAQANAGCETCQQSLLKSLTAIASHSLSTLQFTSRS